MAKILNRGGQDAAKRIDDKEKAKARLEVSLMPEKTITIQSIYSELAMLDPKIEIGSESFKAAVVMLSALSVGQNVIKISRFTGLPRSLVAKFAARLRKNGVWQKGRFNIDWFKKGEGTIAFFMDVNVALGFMERKKAA